jgi:hypothetical protein
MKKLILFGIIICTSISMLAQTAAEIQQIRTAAERGDAEAQAALGLCYYAGQGVAQNNSEALKWIRKSAEKDYVPAQVLSGAFYYGGIGTEQNTETSLYWCEKAYKNWGKMSAEMIEMLSQQGITKSFLENIINELKTPTPKTATYLTTSTTEAGFSASGGTKTITVSTDGSSYDVSYLPTWCSVSKSSGYFTLVCEGNTGDARTDWFKVKSDSKEIRIDVSQSAGVKLPSAKIENIWVEHNFFCGYNRKCLKIHVKFTVDAMLYKQGNCNAYFYFQNGNRLTDYNGQYNTTDGQVSVGESFKPSYESAVYNDFTLAIPHDEFHLGRGAYYLKFNVCIFDNNGNQIATSNYVDFTYSY